MSETRIGHNVHVPHYQLGNTYCAVCHEWLHAGRPHEEEFGRVNDLLSLADSLAEAARHLLEHTEHKGNACKLLAVGQTTNALAAWDAARGKR